MSTEKRQRQRENRMRAAAQTQRSQQRSRRTRKVLRFVIIVAVVVLGLFLYSQLSGDDSSDSTATATTIATAADEAADDPADDPEAFETDEPSDAAEPEPVATTTSAAPSAPGCPSPDGSDGPRSTFDSEPPVCIDVETIYAAAFETSMGDFTMVLDPRLDPVSVNNFVVLGRYGALDGTLFHRVIAGFVIQGGDVELAYGTGGPGYRFTGGFAQEGWYRIGSVAMANAGSPASNGSQFFVITGNDGASLPPLYSPLGHVVEGLDVVLAIEGVPTGDRDAPVDEVVAHSVTISEASASQIEAYEDARS